MRRVAFAVFGTIAGLVGLLTFKTHPTSVAAGASAVVGTADTGSATSVPENTASPSSDATASGSTSSGSTSSGSTSAAPSSAASAGTTQTVTGDSEDTRWGPVQVKITVTAGKITSATAIVYPQNNGRDQEINAYAVPQLEQESIGQTTAQIDMVSGATYTSQGYIASLQSALDKL